MRRMEAARPQYEKNIISLTTPARMNFTVRGNTVAGGLSNELINRLDEQYTRTPFYGTRRMANDLRGLPAVLSTLRSYAGEVSFAEPPQLAGGIGALSFVVIVVKIVWCAIDFQRRNPRNSIQNRCSSNRSVYRCPWTLSAK